MREADRQNREETRGRRETVSKRQERKEKTVPGGHL